MPLLGAIVVKEFQTWLRGRLTFAAFAALVLGTSVLVFLLSLLILAPDANAAPALFSTTSTTSANLLVSNRPLFLFGAVAVCLVIASAAVAPAVAASAFAGERERGTLDLLLMQGPGALRIVVGKVLAALLFSVLILSVALPLFAPAWSFGGVPTHQVGIFLLVLTTVTFFFTALGVFSGAVVHSALGAALIAQAVALFVLFGTIGVHLALTTIGGNDVLRPWLAVNPFLALLSGGSPVVEQFARQTPAAYRSIVALPAVSLLPGLTLPAWAAGSIVWTGLGAGLVFLSSVAVDPCHRLRAWRHAP